MTVRPRTDDDLEQCVAMAWVVHQRDNYPAFLPTDLRTFLVSPDELCAWVAEDGDRIVGHVALHRRTTETAMALAAQTLGQPVERLGVVARLLVAPSARRQGVGRALLGVASRAAIDRELWPVLDVVTSLQGAIDLYERSGWRRAGKVTLNLPSGLAIDEYVYIGSPSPD